MFQLTKEEADSLRFQVGILKTGEQSVEIKQGRGQHRKYLPYVFTEQAWQAFQRFAQQTRDSGEYRHHEDIC